MCSVCTGRPIAALRAVADDLERRLLGRRPAHRLEHASALSGADRHAHLQSRVPVDVRLIKTAAGPGSGSLRRLMHMHAAELGAAVQLREHLSGIEQVLRVEGAFHPLLLGEVVLR